jgi:hypothetical protein
VSESILGFLPWLNYSGQPGIPITQFHLPNGRRTQEWFDPSSEPIRELAQQIVKAGGRFEAEILTTGQVSLTVAYKENNEELDIAMILCRNEYGFIARAFELLVVKAAARIGRSALKEGGA